MKRLQQFLPILLLVVAMSILAIHGIQAQTNPTGQAPTAPAPGQPPVGINPSDYLSNLYIWFLGFVGISALFAFVMGGTMYMFSGPNITKVEQAKKWIWNGIFGLILAAASYIILNTINPDLVQGFDINTVIQKALQESGGHT